MGGFLIQEDLIGPQPSYLFVVLRMSDVNGWKLSGDPVIFIEAYVRSIIFNTYIHTYVGKWLSSTTNRSHRLLIT